MHQCFCSEARTDQTPPGMGHRAFGLFLNGTLKPILFYPLPQTGTPPTSPVCSKPHPTPKTQRSNKELN